MYHISTIVIIFFQVFITKAVYYHNSSVTTNSDTTIMLIKEEKPTTTEEYFNYQNSDNSDEEGELKIDLDYNDYIKVSIEEGDAPIDLSFTRVSEHLNDSDKACISKTDIKPNLIFSSIVDQRGIQEITKPIKDFILTQVELEELLDPYVIFADKKFTCKVCDMKFVNKTKAVTHISNKHVDCLHYKCPLCRASKKTRLAYESHIRRGHGVKAKEYSPIIRCKDTFYVKSKNGSKTSIGQPYDFEFVTFLRDILSLGQEVAEASFSWHKTFPCAEWIEKDQGVFRINDTQELSTRWCNFKVNFNSYILSFYIFFLSRVLIMFHGTICITPSSQILSTKIFSSNFLVVILSSKYFVLNSF